MSRNPLLTSGQPPRPGSGERAMGPLGAARGQVGPFHGHGWVARLRAPSEPGSAREEGVCGRRPAVWLEQGCIGAGLWPQCPAYLPAQVGPGAGEQAVTSLRTRRAAPGEVTPYLPSHCHHLGSMRSAGTCPRPRAARPPISSAGLLCPPRPPPSLQARLFWAPWFR